MSRLLFIIIFLFPILVSAQKGVTFIAEADARQVIVGGYFEMSFTLANAQGSNFVPPAFKDFKVLSGPSQSISTSSFNGKWTKTISYSYNLQPKRIGKFTIGSATIAANGKKMTTKPVTVEVVQGKNNTAKTQQELEAQIEDQVYIKTIPSTIDAYVGQQIVLDYKIYTSQQVENYKPLEESTYPGFFAEELSSYSESVVKEVIDGVQFSTKVINKMALFPQQAGILNIEPLRMRVSIVSPNQSQRRRSVFSYPNLMHLDVGTEPLSINVKSLPPGAPASFSGAVGSYVMQARINSRQINTNDAFSLQLTVQGDGDLKQVQAPDLVLGDSFEIFDTKVVRENALVESQGRFIGEKVFDYLITPKHKGLFKIQPQFSYFSMDSLRYITLTTRAPLALSVLQGDNSKASIEKTAVPKNTLKGIKTSTSWEQPARSFFGTSLFWILLGLPVLVLGGVFLFKQRQIKLSNIDPQARKQQLANKVALKRLETAKTLLTENKSRAFYDEISRAMLGYVSDKLNIPFSKMSKNNVKEKLESLKVSETPIQKFIHIINTSEMALFAGKDNSSSMQEVYQEALDVVSGVEAEIS